MGTIVLSNWRFAAPETTAGHFHGPGNAADEYRNDQSCKSDVSFGPFFICPPRLVMMKKIFEAIKAGASGYLLKHEPAGVLQEAVINKVGGAPMSPAIARELCNCSAKQQQ